MQAQSALYPEGISNCSRQYYATRSLKGSITPFNLLYYLKEQRINIRRSKGNLRLLRSHHFPVILSQLASGGNIAAPWQYSQIAWHTRRLISPHTRGPLIQGFYIRDPRFSILNSGSLDSYLKKPTKRYRGPVWGIKLKAQLRAGSRWPGARISALQYNLILGSSLRSRKPFPVFLVYFKIQL